MHVSFSSCCLFWLCFSSSSFYRALHALKIAFFLKKVFCEAPASSLLERVGVRFPLHALLSFNQESFFPFFEKSLCHFFCLPKKSNQKKGSEFDPRWF
jgi:hypothetical protein